ncbi:MAG: DUF4159 domain-containing protein [Polyangia bacterium]
MLKIEVMLRAICLACALACLPSAAQAIGDKDMFAIAQIAYAGNWNPRSTAARRIAWELAKRTSIAAVLDPVEVRLGDEAALKRHPFLYLAGDGALPAFDDADVARLRRVLQTGGFLVVDGADPRPGGGFDQSVRALVARLFPREPLHKISPEHVVYKSFYLLKAPVGRVAAVPYLEGVEHDGRLVVVYSQNDMGGAWARDNYGQWEHEVLPGGDGQRELSFRLGINLAMYALCLDYKTDQVHVPFILRRRQWQSEPRR